MELRHTNQNEYEKTPTGYKLNLLATRWEFHFINYAFRNPA